MVGLVSLPASSQAGIVFTPGNHHQPGEENVLLNDGSSGTTVFGRTNTGHILVEFTSVQELLLPSGGQARVEALSCPGGTQIGLPDVTVSVPGHLFDDLIFDLHVGGGPGHAGGTVNVFATDELHKVYTDSFTTGTGENFLTLTTTAGDKNDSVVITVTAPGVTDLRQPRISGVSAIGAIPEPTSIVLMLTGLPLPLVMLGVLRRRRAAA